MTLPVTLVGGYPGLDAGHGTFYLPNMMDRVFTYNVTAVTVPAIASNLVSVFTLYNPVASGVVAELLETTIGQVLATTVVDSVAWYFSSPANTALGTFTTPGTPLSGRVGDTTVGAVVPYSAYTHHGTPVRQGIVGSFGATTDAGLFAGERVHNGRTILLPGVAMSIAMSTAAGTSSGLDLQTTWAEWPGQ